MNNEILCSNPENEIKIFACRWTELEKNDTKQVNQDPERQMVHVLACTCIWVSNR